MAFWRPFEDKENVNPVSSFSECFPEFKNKDLHVQCQRVILNIYECLKKENAESLDKNIIKRISELTKLSVSTIYRVIKEGTVIDHSVKRKRIGQKFREISDGDRDVIRRIVYNLYKESKVPTLEMIQEKLKDYPDYKYNCLATLRGVLIDCGFRYKKIDNRMVIMESQRIVALRQEYLRKIKEYRQLGRCIIYLDETWFDTHDVIKYGWVDNSKNCSLSTPCSRGKRIIILHAGSEKGFVPNGLLLSAKNISQSCADYHEDMTAQLFEKWIVEQLLPNIPSHSVIVMDNASYHSRLLNKVPNNNNKKQDIINFMRNKNINIPEPIPRKKDLLGIIKSLNIKKEYVVDKLCKDKGHTVLRLPPYYCVFNPIEIVWGIIKRQLRKINQSPTLSETVVDNIRKVVNELDNEVWKNCVDHVVQKESEYPVLPSISPIIIQPDLDSDSSSDDYDM